MDEHGLRARPTSVPAREAHLPAVLITGEASAGRCALVETVEERGAEPPHHLHHREDEMLYVLEGSLSVRVAGGWIEVPAGAAVFLPRGVEHAFCVASETARVLSFFMPAGFEGLYREVGASGGRPFDVERLVSTAARYGCEITGPPPVRPGARDGEIEEARTARDRVEAGDEASLPEANEDWIGERGSSWRG